MHGVRAHVLQERTVQGNRLKQWWPLLAAGVYQRQKHWLPYLCHASSHAGLGMTPIPASLYTCTVTSSMLLNLPMAARPPACTLPLHQL